MARGDQPGTPYKTEPASPPPPNDGSLWALAQWYASQHSSSSGFPIPDASAGSGSQSSVPSADALNSTGVSATTQQEQVAAENSTLALIYGRAIVGAKIVDFLEYNGNLVIIAVWGQGPVNEIESVYLDDAAAPSGTTITSYDGTQTSADATLVAAYAAQSPAITFADVFANVAYSVVVLPPGITTGFPRITAIVQGLKLFDHRSSTTAYSDNPALALADFHTNATYGCGDQVDWDSVDAVADACDDMVGGTEKRRTIGLVIDEAQSSDAWMETLRAYAGCFLSRNGALLTLTADRPASSAFTFSETSGNCRVRNVKRRGKRDVPTVVALRYTDTSDIPWRDNVAYAYAAGAREGTAQWKIREVAMPGITRFSQAQREATEQLNKLSILDLTCTVDGQDEALAVTMGDVVTVTANVGLSAREMRVVGPINTPTLGRPSFELEAYDPAVYSDDVAAGPTIADTNLPDPANLSAPTGLAITETVYLERVNGSSLAGGLIYQSRFDCTWTAPTSSFPVLYRVELLDGATKIRDETVATTSYSTPAVQQGKTYTVKVYSRNSVAESASPATSTQTAQGKLLKPGAVPSCTGRELGGKVLLAWTAAVDIDVMRYEWRYTPSVTDGGSWGAATLIDRVDGLSATFEGLPVGTHRFYVRPIDSVGQYSDGDCTADITVTSDASAFLQTTEFTSPMLTNMIEIQPVQGVWKKRWVTSVSSDDWNSIMPSPLDSGGAPVDSYRSSATCTWQGEPWDLGSSISGAWTLSASVTDISGTPDFYIETSDDGSTYTRQPGVAWQGSTRFIRPLIEGTGTTSFRVDEPPQILLAALVRQESDIATTSASAATLVQLENAYAFAQDLQATAVNQVGGVVTSRDAVADRLLLHPQTGLCFYLTVPSGTYTSGATQKISAAARTILADDYLEYDVFIDPSSPAASTFSQGGFRLLLTSDTVVVNANDADGYAAHAPATGFDALARGAWKSRKIPLSAYAGAVTSSWNLSDAAQGVGNHKMLYRRVRITDGAGANRLSIWSSGEPSPNTLVSVGIQTNVQCGPSNSFNLYAFTTSTGAQVASDVRWSFKGF